MSKINKESINIIEEKMELLKNIIPECFSEGVLDIEKLRKTIGETLDVNDEKYSFRWAGRNNTFKNIQKTSKGTLVANKKESINFDETENIFIEGDNLEVLKLLQKSYSGKIKMIYIDPPYNTGNDFIYKDDFKNSLEAYLEQTEQIKDGLKLSTNPETSGRYHSDWISMIYPRLFLAREFLRNDGLIFVSIDDNEVHNLKMIMNEIFGEENFQGCISRVTGTPTGAGAKAIVNEIDYVLVYSKTSEHTIEGLELTDDDEKIYDKEDENGKYLIRPLRRTGGEDRREDRPTMFYPLKNPDGDEVYPIAPEGYESRWRCGLGKYNELNNKNLIEWNKVEKNGKKIWQVYQKFYLEGRLKQPTNLWKDIEGNKKATRDLKELFDGKKIFDFPKPVELIQKMIQLSSTESDSIIMDFFVGSGTTAHSVLQQNYISNSKNKFICIQLPEKVEKNTEAFKEGYPTIAEIAKERIKRVIKKIKEENKQQKLKNNSVPDLGFKVFKLAKSNFKIWENYEGKDDKKLKEQMKLFESPLINGYKDEDVIYECIIKEGLDLNSKIEEIVLKSNKVYKISDNGRIFYIILDKTIKPNIIEDLNLTKEKTLICLDGSLDDSQKTNLAKQCNLKTL